VAVVVLALPRIGWLAGAGAAVAWLIASGSGRPGFALLAAAGLTACPLLLPHAGRSWSAPALAPLLGLVGFAAAFPALAGHARRATHRAALGALGFWWLALAEVMLDRRLHAGPPPGAETPARWSSSAAEAAAHALAPVLASGQLAGALVWGVAAVALPWVVRGPWPLAVIGASSWAAGLVLADAAAARLAAGAASQAPPRGAVAAALVGAVLAVAVRSLRGPPASRPGRVQEPLRTEPAGRAGH
jgi:hypothetical protein